MQKNESKNSLTKRVALVVIALLLAFVLAFGGYTLAKYVSSKQTSTSAMVAKWGFTVSADAGGLFGTDYTGTGLATIVTSDSDGVAVNAGSAVVAPGTTGSMTFGISGQAEVLAKIKIEMEVTSDVKLTTTGDPAINYSPIKYTLTKNTSTALVTDKTLEDVKTAIEGQYTGTTDAGTEINDSYTLTWKWAFDNTDTETDSGSVTGNDCDTILGLYANSQSSGTIEHNGTEYTIDTENTSTTISFSLSISVEQVQSAE